MKVEKVVGWIQGRDGVGNVFEISNGGGFLLASIWSDGKFHYLDYNSMMQHVAENKAVLQSSGRQYQAGNFSPDQITVSNPDGWKRLYAPDSEGQQPQETETETGDELVIPVKVEFTGQIKISMAGFSALLKLIE